MSGLLPKIDRSKTVKSKDYRGSSSFATFMIVGRECSSLHGCPVMLVSGASNAVAKTCPPQLYASSSA